MRTDAGVLHTAIARLLGYRWPAENDPDMELAEEQRAWVEKGEIALPSLEDKDGIVCIPSVRGERPAHERLLQLLHAAYGDKWNDGILGKLLAESGGKSLDDWLRNKFFDEHCKTVPAPAPLSGTSGTGANGTVSTRWSTITS